MSITFDGQLEIDHERGVVYFHGASGRTILRFGGLPPMPADIEFIDLLRPTAGISYTKGGEDAE